MTTPVADFGTLGVPDKLVDALRKQGIEQPFDIQAATIPDALAGRDVLGRAPTGSGKTLAFGIPLLARLGESESRRPRGLILSPTRELAEQIRRELQPLATAVGRNVLAVYGGVGLGPQAKALRQGVDLLVACPGRLQDLIDRGEVSMNLVDYVVVDEADRMADMGFLPAVRALLDLTQPKRQTVLFSATLDRDVKILIDNYQTKPVTHEIGQVEPDLSSVDHRFIATHKEKKIGLTADLIDDAGPTMVFCRTRHGVDRVARQLKRAGVKAGWIHGGRSQNQRDAALHAFTNGKVMALVATDVAARGIHVDGVACVIHFDPPADNKDYVHRSGRTARAGAGGVVVSLVNDDQQKAVSKLQKSVGLPRTELEPTPELQVRELASWVDERPKKSRSSKPSRGRRSRSEGSRSDGNRSERPERSRSERPERNRSERPERSERSERSERPERSNRGERDRSAAKGRSSRPAKPGQSKPGQSKPGQSKPGQAKAGRTKDDRVKQDSSSKPKSSKADATKGRGQGRKKGPKRSGRARTKTHKQSRRSTV